MPTINVNTLARGAGDVLSTPEKNFSNEYFWMENAKGRRVPVAVERERECLKQGYIHTDRVVHSDDLDKRVKTEPQAQDPLERLANTLEKAINPKKGKVEEPKAEEVEVSEEELEKARTEYQEKHGELPNRYKNDYNWIISKL